MSKAKTNSSWRDGSTAEGLSCRRVSTGTSCYSLALAARCPPAKAAGAAPIQQPPKATISKLSLKLTQPKGPRERWCLFLAIV